jgi:hypothetical protein
MDHHHVAALQHAGAVATDAAAHINAAACTAPAGAAAGFAPAGTTAGSTLAGTATLGADTRLAAPLAASLSSPVAVSARAAGLIPSGLGLPGYPATIGALTGLLSPTHLPRQLPGFSTTRPLAADATWTSTTPSTDSALASTIAAIQAALEALKERERATTRALEQERTLGATLAAQMAIA